MATSSSIVSLRDVKRSDRLAPSCKWDAEMEAEIQRIVRSGLATSDPVGYIFNQFETHYTRPCHDMAQLSKRTKKQQGNLWEHFSLMYLKAKGYGDNAWLIGDVPDAVLEELNLGRQDMGIDIVIKHKNGYFAVQAKWRSNPRNKAKIALTWNMLSTFYSLCARTGGKTGWLKYIVICNADYVRRQGKKYAKDQTIPMNHFRKCPRAVWQTIAGMSPGNSMIATIEPKPELTPEQVRQKRLEILSKLSVK